MRRIEIQRGLWRVDAHHVRERPRRSELLGRTSRPLAALAAAGGVLLAASAGRKQPVAEVERTV